MADYPRIPGPGGGQSDDGLRSGEPSSGGPSSGGPNDSRSDNGTDRDATNSRRHARRHTQSKRQKQGRGHVPQVRQILEAMAQLPQLVMLRIITPAQCNAVLTVMRNMLTQLQAGSSPVSSQAVPNGLKDAIRQTPELFNFLAAWLPREQLVDLFDDEEDEDETDAHKDGNENENVN